MTTNELRGINRELTAIVTVVGLMAVIVALVALTNPRPANAQRGPKPNAWVEEHSGHPYVGADVHYVLDFGPYAGHPRPAKVILAGFPHGRVDLKVELTPRDVPEGAPTTIDVLEARKDSGGAQGTWHWPPDPRDYRTPGQTPISEPGPE